MDGKNKKIKSAQGGQGYYSPPRVLGAKSTIGDTRPRFNRGGEIYLQMTKNSAEQLADLVLKNTKDSLKYSESLINTVREPLVVLDGDLRIVSVSASFLKTFRVKKKDTIGKLIYNLGNKQWNIPKLKILLESIIPKNSRFDNFEVEHNFPIIGKKIMLLNASRIPRPPAEVKVILLAIEDVTDRKKLTRELESERRMNQKLNEAIDKKNKIATILKTQKEFSESILNTTPAIILVLDKAGKIIYFNPYFEKISGSKLSEVKGKDWFFNFLPKKDRVRTKKLFLKGKGGMQIPKNISQVIVKSGGQKWIEWHSKALKESGKITELLFIGQDVTDKEKAEEQFKNLADNLPNMIFINYRGRLVYVNDECERKMGYSKEEFTAPGFDFRKLVVKEDRKKLAENMDRHNEGIKVLPTEYEIIGKGGKKMNAIISTTLINYKDKKTILGIITDITDQKKFEDKLQESERRFRNISDEIDDGLGVFYNHQLVWVNKALVKIFGGTKKQMVGKKPTDFVIDKYKAQIAQLMSYYEKGRMMPKMIEVQTARADGRLIDLEVRMKDIQYNGGRAVQVVVRDVTERNQTDRTKTEFVSLASHQLRTPLTAINWFVEMILEDGSGNLTPKQKDYLDKVYQSNARMTKLIRALLNVSRIELGTFIIQPKLVNLKKILQSSVIDAQILARVRKVKIQQKIGANLPAKMKLDYKLMRIIMQNLLVNAVKYSKVGGTVRVSLNKMGRSIKLSIADKGYGIPAEQKHLIFEKLFRADNIKQKDTDGTGLGLYMVKSILDHVKGSKIWFTSRENRGSTFYVTLPLSGMTAKKGKKTLE